MMISCGHGGLASGHCVCQKVFASPSTAFAPLPSSPAVSSLSTLTSLSDTFTAGAAGAGVAGIVQQADLLDWQPLASSAHTASTDAPARRESSCVFMVRGVALFCCPQKILIRRMPRRPAEALRQQVLILIVIIILI